MYFVMDFCEKVCSITLGDLFGVSVCSQSTLHFALCNGMYS